MGGGAARQRCLWGATLAPVMMAIDAAECGNHPAAWPDPIGWFVPLRSSALATPPGVRAAMSFSKRLTSMMVLAGTSFEFPEAKMLIPCGV